MSVVLQSQAEGRAYSAMVNTILRQLSDGDLRVGDRLPTERELSETYAISINSVRKGIGLFVAEGLLTRQRGSGVYVSALPGPLESAPAPRDTVVLHYDTWFRHYHPYYTELRRGIADGLRRLGWKQQMLTSVGDDPYQADMEVVYGTDSQQPLSLLAGQRGMAGAIMPASYADELVAMGLPDQPIVVVGQQDALPYVGYDWDAETRAACEAALYRGARRIALIGSPAKDPRRALELAAAIHGCDAELGPIAVLNTPAETRRFSRLAAAAAELTRDFLAEHPETDGIVVGSDFEAQGVFDAVADWRAAGGRPIALVAMASQESRILSALPYDSVVVDGYAAGQAVVDLLDSRIRYPETAARAVILHGQLHRHDGAPR